MHRSATHRPTMHHRSPWTSLLSRPPTSVSLRDHSVHWTSNSRPTRHLSDPPQVPGSLAYCGGKHSRRDKLVQARCTLCSNNRCPSTVPDGSMLTDAALTPHSGERRAIGLNSRLLKLFPSFSLCLAP